MHAWMDIPRATEINEFADILERRTSHKPEQFDSAKKVKLEEEHPSQVQTR